MKALQLHQSFLLSTNKPQKKQKSPTKSLKVMISGAINSQVLHKLALGTEMRGSAGRRQRALALTQGTGAHGTLTRCCRHGFQHRATAEKTNSSAGNTHKTIQGKLDFLLKDRTKRCTCNTECIPVHIPRSLFHSKTFAGARI